MNVVWKAKYLWRNELHKGKEPEKKTIIYRNFEKMNITEQVKQKTPDMNC